MAAKIDPISTPPTPADPPSVFEERASQVWADLFKAVPQMNQQALDIDAIGEAADAAKRSAQADSDAALGYRNEANAAKTAALGHAGSAAQSSADADVSRVAAVEAAGDAGSAAGRAEAAAAAAESVVVNAIQQTSLTGAAQLPEGTDAQRPAAGGIPAGKLLVRGSTQDPGDYKPEFWDRVSATWKALASRHWVSAITAALSQRIDELAAAPKPIAPGSAPQFVCRAWVNFNGTTIRASGNVSSITKSSTGVFVANLTIPLADTNGATNCTGSQGAIARLSTSAVMQTNSTCRMEFNQVNVGNLDPDNASLTIFR